MDLSRKPPKLWVVVCADLHNAWGPFPDLGLALAYARERTDARETPCTYLPVELHPAGGAYWEPVDPRASSTGEYKPGPTTYL